MTITDRIIISLSDLRECEALEYGSWRYLATRRATIKEFHTIARLEMQVKIGVMPWRLSVATPYTVSRRHQCFAFRNAEIHGIGAFFELRVRGDSRY